MINMSLVQEVKTFLALALRESGIALASSDKIVAAVSGGPDSLVLLHLLAIGRLHPAKNIIVAHLDHKLRPSSTVEAEHVRQIATEWNLACHIERADIHALAQAAGLSLEEAGRKARYRFFGKLADEVGAGFIFTGHHAGDQAETVLMHILRGSGTAGLRGILPVSPLFAQHGKWVVRPLLNTTREQIETYCEQHQLNPLIDETNVDTNFFRNRLRHELLPILEEYNPQIGERLRAMAAVVAADFDSLERQTAEAWEKIILENGEGWVRFDLSGWQQLHLSLRRRILRKGVLALRPNLRDVGFQSIEQARQVAEKGLVGSEATFPGQVSLIVGYTDWMLRLADVKVARPDAPQLLSEEPVALSVPGRLDLANSWTLTCEPVSKLEPAKILGNHNHWVAYLDIGTLDSLVVRPRLPGERFQPFGMEGQTKSVKDLMIDRKIPAELRPLWPIIAGEHLFWIPGHMMDERTRVSPNSLRVVKLSLSPFKAS